MWTGWKDIEKAAGLCRNTMMDLVNQEDFPIVWIGNKPTLTEAAMNAWHASKKAGSRLLQKRKKKGNTG